MAKQLLIGLCGKAGCGKDTMAQYFTMDAGLQRYALAQPMKQALTAMLDVPPGMIEDRVYKETVIPWVGKSPRQLLQTLGTEWGRDLVNKDLWVNLMVHRWEVVQSLGLPGMVVTDVRFPNEAEKIKLRGGHIYRIHRPCVDEVAFHSSEQGIPDGFLSGTIYNDEGLQKLRVEAARIVRGLQR
jgi:hypothetical protein